MKCSGLGVGRVTVGDWKRKRSELEKWSCDCNSEEHLKKERVRKGVNTNKQVKHCFYDTLTSQKEFEDGEQDFKASVGCLDR